MVAQTFTAACSKPTLRLAETCQNNIDDYLKKLGEPNADLGTLFFEGIKLLKISSGLHRGLKANPPLQISLGEKRAMLHTMMLSTYLEDSGSFNELINNAATVLSPAIPNDCWARP